MQLSLFVYGSLRPGQCNYDQLQDHVLSAQTVHWPGRLHLRPEGYPALVLPPGCGQILAHPYVWEVPLEPPGDIGGGPVEGEWLTLRDSQQIRRRLDDFEGFTPRVQEYLRVAVACQGQWVWTYVASGEGSSWPVIASWPIEGMSPPPWRC